MPWQNVVISRPSRLSIRQGGLHIVQAERELTLPLADIASLTLESREINLTMPVLAACAQAGVAVLVCNEAHTPNGVLNPLGNHSKQAEISQLQREWTPQFKQLVWEKCVLGKISLQLSVLHACGAKSARMERLVSAVTQENASDTEAQAARTYWPLLFGESFKRQAMTSVSYALDYGYTIVRAGVARALCGYGFYCAWGVHHKHPQNAFNLADDMVETFRPFVDWWVRGDGTLDDSDTALTQAQRARLTQVMQIEVKHEKRNFSLQTAIDQVAQSLATATQKGNAAHFKVPTAQQLWRLSDGLPDG